MVKLLNQEFEKSKPEKAKPALDEKLEPDTKLKESQSQEGENDPLEIVGGHYEILKLIAEGGMSTVYLARHTLLDQLVAVKFLLPKLVHDKNTIARFRAEAQAASTLQHPNIASVREFGFAEDERAFIVMEYVEGLTLENYIKQSTTLDTVDVLNLIIQLCDGLNYAHSEGVIHRDLKPANISIVETLNKKKQLKILDFGIAKILRDDDSGPNLTKTGDIFGTPKYMSPEQCYGEPVDARSDVYSVGCILFECVTGEAPFQSESILELMMMQVQEDVDLSNESLTDEIKFVISKCMAKNPDHRYQSIDQLQEDLKFILNGGSPLNFTQENLALAQMRLSQTSNTISADLVEKSPSKHKAIIVGIILGLMGSILSYYMILVPILKPIEIVKSIETSINKSGLEYLNEGKYSEAYDKFKTAFDESSEFLKRNEYPKKSKELRTLRNHALDKMILVSHIKGETKLTEKLQEQSTRFYKEHVSETDKIDNIIELWKDFPRTSKNKKQFDDRANKMLKLASDLLKDNEYKKASNLTKLSLDKLKTAGEADENLVNEFRYLYAQSIVEKVKSSHSFVVSAEDLEYARRCLATVSPLKENSKVYYYLAYLESLQGNSKELKIHLATAENLENNESNPISPQTQLVKAAIYEYLGKTKEAKTIIEKQISILEKEQDNFLKNQAQYQMFGVITEVDGAEKARTYLKDKISKFGKDKHNMILAKYYARIAASYHSELAKRNKNVNSAANPLDFGDARIADMREFKFAKRFYIKSLSIIQRKEVKHWSLTPTLRQLSYLYLLAHDYENADIYMKEWIAANQLRSKNHSVSQDISTLGMTYLMHGDAKNKEKANKIYKGQLKLLLSTPSNETVSYDIWFSDLSAIFANSKDKELILKRLEESKSLAKKRFEHDLKNGIATTASGTKYVNQLNMLAKTLFTFGKQQKAFDNMTEAVKVIRTGKVAREYCPEIFYKYSQLLDLQNKKEEAKRIREEMKQYQIQSN